MRMCSPHNQFQSGDNFCVVHGVQTSFYESTPSASDSLGNTIPPRDTEDSGNARANFPNASEERNLRNISRHFRILFERIPGTQGIWRVASSYRLKTTEPPELVNIHAPCKKHRQRVRHKVPWYNHEVNEAKLVRRRMERKWRWSMSEYDYLQYKRAKFSAKDQFC